MATLSDQIWHLAQTPTDAVLLLRAYYRAGMFEDKIPMLAITPQAVKVSVTGYVTPLKVAIATIQRLLQGSSFNPWEYLTPLQQGRLWLHRSTKADKVYRVLCVGVATALAGRWGLVIAGTALGRAAASFDGLSFSFSTALQGIMDLARRGLPSYTTLSKDEAIASAWSTVRLQHNPLVLWSYLLCEAIQKRAEEVPHKDLSGLTPDPIARDLLSVDSKGRWLADLTNLWDQSLPVTGITLDQIWIGSINRSKAIALARAYYRTGQLHPRDQPIVATCDFYSNLGDAEFMNSIGHSTATLRDYVAEMADRAFLGEQISPATSLLVEAAIPYLNQEELVIYRVNQFRTFMLAYIRHGKQTFFDIFTNVFEDLETGLDYHPVKTNMEVVDWWSHLYAQMDRINVEAYVSTRNTILITPPMQFIDDAKLVLSEVNFETEEGDQSIPPRVRAYTHLLQSLLANPVDPIGQALETSPPYPQIYTAMVPSSLTDGKWLVALLPPLNGIISEYAFIPTYDEVLARIAAL